MSMHSIYLKERLDHIINQRIMAEIVVFHKEKEIVKSSFLLIPIIFSGQFVFTVRHQILLAVKIVSRFSSTWCTVSRRRAQRVTDRLSPSPSRSIKPVFMSNNSSALTGKSITYSFAP